MKKVLVYIIVFALLGAISAYAKSTKKQDAQVISTQGYEVNNQTSQKIIKAKNNNKPAKTQRKNRNKYLKNIKNIEKTNNKKRIKNRDLNFLNNQLEIKKNKLEELNSNVKKGENQK